MRKVYCEITGKELFLPDRCERIVSFSPAVTEAKTGISSPRISFALLIISRGTISHESTDELGKIELNEI